jgi:hypothetical protein
MQGPNGKQRKRVMEEDVPKLGEHHKRNTPWRLILTRSDLNSGWALECNKETGWRAELA